jgi:hypothetical protein
LVVNYRKALENWDDSAGCECCGWGNLELSRNPSDLTNLISNSKPTIPGKMDVASHMVKKEIIDHNRGGLKNKPIFKSDL